MGYSASGPQTWRTKDGRTLKELESEALYLNYAEPTANLLNYTSPYYKDYPVEYDPEKARKLAREVLGGQRCEVVYCINGGEPLQKGEAELISYWLQSIGLDVTIQSLEYATMARQMRALVEQLLTLARSDSGSQRPALTPLNLSQLIQTRMLPFEALFYERGLRLRDEITDGLRVSGDAQTLGQVVDILLDNAQKYATGGEVIVRLQPQSHGRCLLTVTNEAPPLSQAELANLFKRFYRADPARSASGSFGLGLAIASQAVEAHHGRIWAACHGSTITFSVLLRQLP